MDIDGEDADGIRALHLLCKNAPSLSSTVEKEDEAPSAGSAAEESAQHSKAVAAYTRLKEICGIHVAQKRHLDYALMSQLDNLQHKNGTINKRIGLTNLVAQCNKKKQDRELGFGLRVQLDENDMEEEAYKYNEVTLMLPHWLSSHPVLRGGRRLREKWRGPSHGQRWPHICRYDTYI